MTSTISRNGRHMQITTDETITDKMKMLWIKVEKQYAYMNEREIIKV